MLRIFVLVGVLLLASTAVQGAKITFHEHYINKTSFIKGISGTGVNNESIAALTGLNATHCRRYVFWKSVEPELHTLNEVLSVAALKADPEGLIYNWSAGLDWSWPDAQVQSLVRAGVRPIIEVGEGTFFGIPKYNETIADPGVIGLELYLAYQYRFCRAATRRYKKYADLWQIENELNEALLSTLYGQRLLTDAWGNWTFLTQLLHTLKEAVQDEDPHARVTMNFHTDVPKAAHQLLNLSGYYLDAVKDWGPIFDVVSFDAYPCMYISNASRGVIVGERLGKILTVLNHTKKVFVMETGYPVDAADNHPNASVLQFTPKRQAEYIEASFHSVVKAGGVGYFYFKMVPDAGMPAPPGGTTPEDAAMMRELRNLLETMDIDKLEKWLFEKGNLEEALERAKYFLGSVGKGWGILDLDNSPRPGFHRLEQLFKKR